VSSELIRVGLLGAARIAPGALIGPSSSRTDVRVVAVAARSFDRAVDFGKEYGIEAEPGGYQGLIDRNDLDLIYVALPPHLHCKWTLAALEAGKHVLCEKPFALNAREAQLMIEKSAQTGQHLIEGFHYRFHDLMEQALSLTQSGLLGKITRASAGVAYPIPMRPGEPRWSADFGGGAMMDLGCYGIHALRTLMGCEPTVLTAATRIVAGVDAETLATLEFASVPASVRAAMDPQQPITSITIEGQQGTLMIDGFVLPHRAGRIRLKTPLGIEEYPVSGVPSYSAQLAHVVEVLRGEAKPLTGGIDALANMQVIDAIKELARAF